MKKYFFIILSSIASFGPFGTEAQPWNNPLMITHSTDGITFDPPAMFQDSSGVPSAIRWHGDTLIAAFQWFRLPNPSPSWDRVAVKFSYDNGLNWTQPTPIVVNGIPASYQRPFDPTLTTFSNDSIRIYFSSSDGMPPLGIDSTVNTYSAKSTDGINYTFELPATVDVDSNRVIDPAVIFFNSSWHYASPIGAPQEGAYHFVSPDGINFSSVPTIFSDNMHNWTGNYMVESPGELRFYGTAPSFIWYNSSANGGIWNGYINTNIHGGDPSVVKVNSGNYLMVYVGPPNPAATNEPDHISSALRLFPNPSGDLIFLESIATNVGKTITISGFSGQIIYRGLLEIGLTKVDISGFSNGIYMIKVEGLKGSFTFVKK